jgi:predicted AAA+ superfamily ATPase
MLRQCKQQLLNWKSAPGRKPLILLGARQVGKTYLIKEFGLENFKNTVYLNFESNADLKRVFEQDLDPSRIMSDLRLLGHVFEEGQTLLVFDEIQNCPRALTSLKYFCEKRPGTHVCAAGSLLGLFLAETSFPVGKVEFLPMYPMSFREFLLALNATEMLGTIERFIEGRGQIGPVQHDWLFERFKQYLIIGGLPEVVGKSLDLLSQPDVSYTSARALQAQLVINYVADMAKHSGKINSMHIERLWHESATQLARTEEHGARKFKFKDVIPNIRGYERLAHVIDWLTKAGLSLKVPICNKSAHPLKAFSKESIFKLYTFDVGILGAMTSLQPSAVASYDFGTYKGFLSENFVLQELHSQNLRPMSWSEGVSEIEFLLESGSDIIPIEVKSGNQTKAKSLKSYRDRYNPRLSVKFSGKHIESIKAQDGVVNLPIYTTGWLGELLAHGLAPGQRS